VFAQHPRRGLSELEIKAEAERLIAALEARGAKIYVPRADRDYAISAGLEMLTLRHVVEEADGLFSARPEEAWLSYYANSIRTCYWEEVKSSHRGHREERSMGIGLALLCSGFQPCTSGRPTR
jgi:hypothetical protein